MLGILARLQEQKDVGLLTKGELLKYSEQNLIDCVTFCFGCSGGSRDGAYLYVIDKQGGQFNLDIDYPYTATDGKYMFIKEKAVGGISDYTQSKKKTRMISLHSSLILDRLQ